MKLSHVFRSFFARKGGLQLGCISDFVLLHLETIK